MPSYKNFTSRILFILIAIGLALVAVGSLLSAAQAQAAFTVIQPRPVSQSILALPSKPGQPEFAPGIVLIGLKAGVTIQSRQANSLGVQGEQTFTANSTPLNTSLTALGVTSSRPVFSSLPASSVKSPFEIQSANPATSLARIYRLRLPPEANVESAVATLSNNPDIEFAEPDYLARETVIPNDPLYASQWGLSQIGAPTAWDVVTGTQTVVIALVDSGIDTTHSDLTGRLWINPGEIPSNGIDDDGNDHLDDVNGWSFIEDSNDISDDDGHGTLVAGVAGAATNNNTGVAGVCWNCRLMPVKVMQGGIANYSDIAAGVLYAAQKGARVINLSLGGYADSTTLSNAINTAVNSYGAVVVAGAGNDNLTTPFYPAAYPAAIGVASTTITDTKASSSNYGDWVDVTAPGDQITTTVLGGTWAANSGTSLSAAFVSGLAGLIRSQNPGWSATLVRSQIIHTADSLTTSDPTYGAQLGAGRINAASAVTQAPHPLLTIESTAVNGDPLGHPALGQTALFTVTLRNDWSDAAGTAGVITTTDPYVTLVNDTASFGTITAGSTRTNSPVYSFSVASGAGFNHSIPITLAVFANFGAYTATFPLTLTTPSANQSVGGTIVTHTVWTSDKTYIVNNNVGVAPGITLTIQPGTVIKFNGNYTLTVGGTLIADGTQAQPIRFMSNTGSNWGRIYFDDAGVDATADITGTYQAGNILRWAQIESAGQGIGCNNATPYLSHVTLTGGGINCTTGSTPAWLMDSDLTGDVVTSFGAWWTSRASMPTARWGLGVATASNGKVYAIGGANGGILATVEEYDPATDTWATRASMPTARYGLGVAAASNGKIYAIGGYNDSSGVLAIVEEYDPTTDTWTTRVSMPTAREGLGVAAANNGKIYAIGGNNSGSGPLAAVEEYDPATDTWITRASVPTARSALGVAAASNGKIYAIGGGNNSGPLATVEEYDPVTHIWTTRASMPTGRYYLGVAAANNGRVYAIGGYYSYFATVEEYNPATDTWTTRASMPTARYGLGIAAASNGKIYAIGGESGGSLATVEEFTDLPCASCVWHTTITGGNLSLPEISQVLTSTVSGSITAGSGGLVQGTSASADITINGNGTVEGSTASAISVGSGSVLSNTVRGGTITVSNNSLVQNNDVESSGGWGISASGNTTLIHNRVVGNASGINADSGLIQENLIANSTGIGLQVGAATVLSNTLVGNGGNAVVVASGAPTFQGNNLENNHGTYDLVNNTANPITATANWWGVTNTATIDTRLYDFYDDFNLGKITYTPVLTSPAQNAPAYVRTVTVLPDTTLGIQTGTFDVQFSRPMDTNSNPQMSFSRPVVWTTQTSMTMARSRLGVTAASNGKIYAIGGENFGVGGYLAVVEEYNPTMNTWVTRASMPTARAGLGVVAANNGKIYAIGGRDINGLFATVEEYDPATNTWATRTSMPTARSYLNVATASNGKIYAIGGSNNGGLGLTTVEEYDPATNTWATRASMPTARYGLSVATANNGKIYAIGGAYEFSYLSTVEEYDPVTNTWATRASMPTARGYLGVTAASNGKLYAIGGSNGGTLATVEEYDPTTNTWVTSTNMPTERFGLGAATTNNGKIYAIGGWNDGSNNYLATVEDATLPFETTAFYNPQWLSSTLYRAKYDITSIVPKGVYTITVSDAFGTDGIEIAPNANYTFTVDYAGGVADNTPPLQPVVTASNTGSLTTISASWSSSDPQTGITQYRYAIGTTPGSRDVVNWTYLTGTSVTRTGLNLTQGQTYYVTAGARNAGGLWSQDGTSNGVVAWLATDFIFLPVVRR